MDERLRKQLVPTARYSPTQLRDGLCAALRARGDPRRRRLMVEYVLIADVNDGGTHARALASFIKPLEEVRSVTQRDAPQHDAFHLRVPQRSTRSGRCALRPPMSSDL